MTRGDEHDGKFRITRRIHESAHLIATMDDITVWDEVMA